MKFQYIVWHTAAHATKEGVALDTSAAEIDQWHKARGWKGIGYQRVIRFDGTIENGRSYDEAGAHVQGLNSRAIGYCFSGHGDFMPLTPYQLDSGLRLTQNDMAEYSIPPENVIGHNEVNDIILRDKLTGVSPVNKSCPGVFVNMSNIRSYLGITTILRFKDTRPTTEEVILATKVQKLLKDLGYYEGKIDGWAGKNTSEAFHDLCGYYLKGDPRI